MTIIIRAVELFFYFLSMMIFIRVLISWIPGINRRSSFVRFIDSFTDPILEPIQAFTFKHLNLGMLDISPVIAIFLLSLIKALIIRFLIFFF